MVLSDFGWFQVRTKRCVHDKAGIICLRYKKQFTALEGGDGCKNPKVHVLGMPGSCEHVWKVIRQNAGGVNSGLKKWRHCGGSVSADGWREGIRKCADVHGGRQPSFDDEA